MRDELKQRIYELADATGDHARTIANTLRVKVDSELANAAERLPIRSGNFWAVVGFAVVVGFVLGIIIANNF